MQFNAASGQSNSGSDAWDICYRISGACSGSAPLAECCSSHCPLRSRLHGIRLVWRTYQQLLTKHPWKVQILTAGSTCGISDIISQQLIERRGLTDHSIKRTIKMTTVGLIYVGPILCKWYKYLDQLVVGKTKVAVFKKVLLDQFVLAPCFLAGFIVVTGFLGGLSLEKIYLKLEKNYTNALMSNYTVGSCSDCCPGVEYLPLLDGK
ncbi:protein Mpv17 isoform X2 [Leucoraja erinacea]|uniref:protein Mpv17 isoform X2 n=1 Tax=Leucoraja erinaceus TaxID=7782 RepID=UPI002458E104|nr:protein Mpv17 isoform X2 [Leucoraja erinacea]